VEYPFKKIVFAEDETVELANNFALGIKPGDVIILNGNLGAGKTFFIKNAVKALGGNNVNSPTFAIINEYESKFKIYHFDFYRINEMVELYDIGFNDYLNNPDAIIFIEWGNLYSEILPKKRITIEIKLNEDFSREFIFTKNDRR
jgi:tRNA threonylcarbamoyladenosine biosynthesis protein TsaE